MEEELVRLLLQYQRNNNLTDSQLADLLGISASLISYLRSGQRGLGIDTVRKIYANIPDYKTHNECYNWALPLPSLAFQKQLEDLKAMR